MKKLILAAAACAALLTVSCTKDPQTSYKATSFQASLSPLTKTSIDGVKVSWEAGDGINVNGVGSYGIEEGGAEASFEMAAEVSAPYNAIYPAILYSSDSSIELCEMLYLDQVTMIPLAAYSESGTSLSFSPVTAVFKVPVTGAEGAELKSVTFKSKGGEQISGPFGIDYTVPELTEGLDDSCQSIEILCGNAPLGTTPIDIYIPVPAGSYSGFEIELETADGTTVVKGTSARTLEAGELRAMPVIDIPAAAAEGGIRTAEDLLAFAQAVNSDASLDAWMNDEGEIALLDDIDMSDFDTWTPIGNPDKTGNGNNACAVEGPRFTGIFNGGGHTIKNFRATSGTIADGCTWGLFGALVCATVKDLDIECDGVIFSAAATADAGILAGTVYCSTISNVNIKGTVECYGTNTDNKRFAIGGIAGFVYSDDEDGQSVIEKCTVELKAEGGSGMNTKAGATGVQFAGIAGFGTTGSEATVVNDINRCTAKGEFKVDVGRSCGILATANCNTVLTECVNYVNQTNGFVNGRIGNVICYLKTNCGIVDCVNYGNLTTTDEKTTAGGLAALLDIGTAYIEGGANYGTVIGANTAYLGLICANCSKFDHISDVTVSGKLGVYGGDMFDVNADNFMSYIGTYSEANAVKITGLTYVAP